MRWVAVALTLLLAGCAEPAAAPDEGEDAGELPTTDGTGPDGRGYLVYEVAAHGEVGERCTGVASWMQPGLYDALPEAQGVEGARVYEARPHQEGLPFEVRGAVGWDGMVVEQVRRDRGREGIFLWLEEGALTISGLFAPSWEEHAIRAAFGSFAENATYADAATRDRWADAFVASKRPGLMSYSAEQGERVEEYSYSARIEPETLALEELWSALGGVATANDTMRLPGAKTLQWERDGEAWSVRFALAVRTLVVDTPEGTLTLDADGSGSAAAYTGGVVQAADPDAWLTETMGRLGLPEPELSGPSAGLGVC